MNADMSEEAELAMKRRRKEAHDKSKGKSLGPELEQHPSDPRLLPSGRRSFTPEQFFRSLEAAAVNDQKDDQNDDQKEEQEEERASREKILRKIARWMAGRECGDGAKNDQKDDQKDDQTGKGKGQEQERAL